MNPRRLRPDLFGARDDSRHFLRRPYFYDHGLDPASGELCGLHHLSFARNLGHQYEWSLQMWQMNSDFPTPGTRRDALFTVGGASDVVGGYFFIPAAADSGLDFIGSPQFDCSRPPAGRVTTRGGSHGEKTG
jgi:hypothetical protein